MNAAAADVARYSPAQLTRLLGLPEPTAEQAAVIGAPLRPMVVAAGAGSGKSETMAARVVWLVANGLVRPERVLGLTFTRKAAAELASRVRRRLDGLRAVGLTWQDVGGASMNGVGQDAKGKAAGPRTRRAPRAMCSPASRRYAPTTPTRGAWSPITRCGRRSNRRSA